jgi:hypothetical protein
MRQRFQISLGSVEYTSDIEFWPQVKSLLPTDELTLEICPITNQLILTARGFDYGSRAPYRRAWIGRTKVKRSKHVHKMCAWFELSSRSHIRPDDRLVESADRDAVNERFELQENVEVLGVAVEV